MIRILQAGRHLLMRWLLALLAVAVGGKVIELLTK